MDVVIRMQRVLQKCKNLFTSDALLVHYDDKLTLKLSYDASPVSLGIALYHIIDNNKRPIAYAIKKFQQHVFGKKFVLVTDHQLLISISAPDKAVHAIATARLQRWTVLLSSLK